MFSGGEMSWSGELSCILTCGTLCSVDVEVGSAIVTEVLRSNKSAYPVVYNYSDRSNAWIEENIRTRNVRDRYLLIPDNRKAKLCQTLKYFFTCM